MPRAKSADISSGRCPFTQVSKLIERHGAPEHLRAVLGDVQGTIRLVRRKQSIKMLNVGIPRELLVRLAERKYEP